MMNKIDGLEYDVVIIGAGVIGTFVARHMAKKDMKIAVLEKESDVCCGVSKAHTAIVHCGYSGKPGSVKAKMTVVANENFHNVCDDLDVEFRRCGSIITAKADKGMEKLHEKLERGKENGVKGLVLLDRKQTLEIEPNISDEVIASVYAPTTGVADPWEYCVAAMENAMDNGVELHLNTKVLDMNYVESLDSGTKINIKTERGELTAQYVINCAGLYSDAVNDMVEDAFFKVAPRRGEYIVLDKLAGKHINGFVFQAREEDAPKGVIISPTIHGNLMVGPSSEDIDDKTDVSNTIEGLEHIKKISSLSVKNIPFEKTISYFAGIRPRPNWIKINEKGEIEGYEDKVKDFIITRGKNNHNFINVAGIKSPGFTCADEIGKYVYEMIYDELKDIEKRADFNPKRKKRIRVQYMEDKDLSKLISENPDYGEVVCKCNMITKGEILDVINRNAGALTVSGVKRRTGASMGKCHGSHCKTKIQKIIDSEIKDTSPKIEDLYLEEEYQTVIIGGGIAGVSIAINLIEKGIKKLAIIERESMLGGILNQCIHHGFGVKYLKKNMTGPEYSNFFIKKLLDTAEEREVCLNIMTDTEAIEIKKPDSDNSSDYRDGSITVKTLNREGLKELKADTIVLTTGCIERHIGQIFISGNRLEGIYTAGEAQRIVNMDGKSVGKRAVIIGSGDIGLIMTRRLIIEGTEVVAIVEKSDGISGLARNKAECADSYGVPIEFNSRIIRVLGKKRVEGIEYEKDGEKIVIDCDAIVTSVGLEPDVTLAEESSCFHSDSIFTLGNSDYVHDLVDDIAVEAESMADNIVEYMGTGNRVDISRDIVNTYGEIKDYDIVCTVCPESCRIKYKGDLIFGNRCPKGRKYAISQRDNPSRYITTTVEIKDGSGLRASVKTARPVKCELAEETSRLMKEIEVKETVSSEKIKLKNGILVEIICPLMV